MSLVTESVSAPATSGVPGTYAKVAPETNMNCSAATVSEPMRVKCLLGKVGVVEPAAKSASGETAIDNRVESIDPTRTVRCEKHDDWRNV